MRNILHPKLPNKFTVSFQNFHKYKWRDRFRIFFGGWNVLTETKCIVDKRTGQVRAGTTLMLTTAVDEKGAIALSVQAKEFLNKHL
jgi:hypothetical protein